MNAGAKSPVSTTERIPVFHVVFPSRFRPHRWLANPHLQIVTGTLLRNEVLPMTIEQRRSDDGDTYDVGWINEHPSRPLAVMVHGLGGNLRSGYSHALSKKLVAKGWACALIQLRGAGETPAQRPLLYHHGDSEDLRSLCRALRRDFPGRIICAVGWSLGASVLIKSLGEEGARSPLDAAVAVSVPLQLEECVQHLRRGVSRIYQDYMLRYLKQQLRLRAEAGELEGTDLEAALAARDMFEFGDSHTAPLLGLRDSREYCVKMNPGRFLPRVRRPLLVLQARDDPFLGPSVYPPREPPPHVRVEMARRGGHVGFISEGRWGRPKSWLEGRVARFLLGAPSRQIRRAS